MPPFLERGRVSTTSNENRINKRPHLPFALSNVDCYQSEIRPQRTLSFHLN